MTTTILNTNFIIIILDSALNGKINRERLFSKQEECAMCMQKRNNHMSTFFMEKMRKGWEKRVHFSNKWANLNNEEVVRFAKKDTKESTSFFS